MDSPAGNEAPLTTHHRMPSRRRLAAGAAIVVAGTLVACRGSAPALAPSSTPADTPSAAARMAALSGSTGNADEFTVTITGIVYGPDRATFELKRAAYITVLSVTEDRILAVTPLLNAKSDLAGSGSRTVALNHDATVMNSATERFKGMSTRGVASDEASAADVQAYNQCLARARQAAANRRKGRAPIIGRDSAGRAIYGPPPAIDEPGDIDYEKQCWYPTPTRPTPATQAARRDATPGRYLLVFASDTPVASGDILELAITEGDVRSMAQVIGRKLFASRNALWSVSYQPW